ncbi:alanine racemase [uncultured Actinomyces sp.]|uniref:alanine racemase n=1 Tax=uncultured Actinomyces sp. TaxID=249061 RepID=UPI0028DB75AA|nr:alanine racemase [uncultured Actinomyces sp.]
MISSTAIPASTSRAVVDLDAVAANARVLARAAGTPWLAVVKADAYGHGLGPVALACLGAGATWLGVAQLSEALRLRELLDQAGVPRPDAGRSAPTSRAPRLLTWILPVLSPDQAAAPGSPLRAALAAGIDVSVSTPAGLDAVSAAARAEGGAARVHIKADTGMSRAGAVAADLPALAGAARMAQDAGDVVVVGLWSHLSRADEPACGSTQTHLRRLEAAERVLADAGLEVDVRHLAATAGLLWHPAARLDLVRAGIGLYGLSPDPAVATSADLGLRPAMRLEAPLVQVKRIPAGQAVSYGGTWTAPTDRWLGLVPLGYADGVPRAASGTGPVTVLTASGPYRTRVVGRVCMDQLVIDLGPAWGVPDADTGTARDGDAGQDSAAGHRDTAGQAAARDGAAAQNDADAAHQGAARGAASLPTRRAPAAAGDTAVLWGDPATTPGVPTADDWARACGTINYEIVTRLGPHVPRVYVGGPRPGHPQEQV